MSALGIVLNIFGKGGNAAPLTEKSRPSVEAAAPRLRANKLWKEYFKGFYQKYSRPLWFYIFKVCGDEQMADDIFQEAFYRFLRADPTGFSENQQKNYLYKIATNLFIDMKRRSRLEQEKTPRENVLEESREENVYLSMDMQKLFKLMKPKERTLLWLAYVEGYSHDEIARITGGSAKSLKVQLFRARKKFGAILKQKGWGNS